MIEKKSRVLSGVSGEYFVAAELSRLGYIASITLRNTKGIDILVSNEDASKSVGLQIKTNQGLRKAWLLGEKCENYFSDNLFYVFVNLKAQKSRPDYHVVPSKVVSEYTKKDYSEWINTPGRKGQKHNETPMRMFRDKEDKYLERWNLLGL